jgi:hypothetical protein
MVNQDNLKYDHFYVVRFKHEKPSIEIAMWNRGDVFLLPGSDWGFSFEEFDVLDEIQLDKY